MGFTPTLPRFVKLSIRINERVAYFYIKHQVDLDLLRDTFVTQEYRIQETINPKIIFDFGSNIGATIIYFKLCYPDATIYAFEPDPQNIPHLRKNVEQFGNTVKVVERAIVAHDTDSVIFYQAKRHHWSSSIYEQPELQNKIEVSAVTIKKIMQELALTSVDVCKFDIEGSEYDLFKNVGTLAPFTWLIGELHPHLFQHSIDDFLALLPDYITVEKRPGRVVILKKK